MRLDTVLATTLATLLGGCATLHSSTPLLPETGADPFLEAGSYVIYDAFRPEQVAALGARKQAQCVDPGYTVFDTDDAGWPTDRRVQLLYCPFDGKGRRNKPTTLARADDGFLVRMPRKKPRHIGRLDWRTQPLAGDFLLYQLKLGNDGEDGAYVYGVSRRRGPYTESYQVPCDDEHAVMAAPGEGGFPDEPAHRPPPPPPHLKCALTSLDAALPDIRAYAASGDKAPGALILRIGD